MIYRFVNDPDLNINFDDNTLYTPLHTPVDIEDEIIMTNKKPTNVSKLQKPVSEPSKNLSLFTWFIIVAIILVCLWYVYGGTAHPPTPSNPKDNTNAQQYSPDYGTQMKYGIF